MLRNCEEESSYYNALKFFVLQHSCSQRFVLYICTFVFSVYGEQETTTVQLIVVWTIFHGMVKVERTFCIVVLSWDVPLEEPIMRRGETLF